MNNKEKIEIIDKRLERLYDELNHINQLDCSLAGWSDLATAIHKLEQTKVLLKMNGDEQNGTQENS